MPKEFVDLQFTIVRWKITTNFTVKGNLHTPVKKFNGVCEVTIGTTAPAFPFREATSSGTYEMIDDEDVGIVEVGTYLLIDLQTYRYRQKFKLFKFTYI